MQKIAIIGNHTDSAELAAAMAGRGVEVVNFHDVELSSSCCDIEALPVECSDYKGGYRHSLEGNYQPSADELAWLNKMATMPVGNYGQREVPAMPYLLGNHEWYDKPAPRPRHSSLYTKPHQPSLKARKAARRRAKAGRKASR